MKKLFALTMLFVLALTLCACGGGKTTDAAILPSESEIYTQEEIDEAIQTAVGYFNRHFDGCTLRSIGYIGDMQMERLSREDPTCSTDTHIVLLSSFETDSTVKPGSLMPGETYTDWAWNLGRDDNGHWQFPSQG